MHCSSLGDALLGLLCAQCTRPCAVALQHHYPDLLLACPLEEQGCYVGSICRLQGLKESKSGGRKNKVIITITQMGGQGDPDSSGETGAGKEGNSAKEL